MNTIFKVNNTREGENPFHHYCSDPSPPDASEHVPVYLGKGSLAAVQGRRGFPNVEKFENPCWCQVALLSSERNNVIPNFR